MSKSHPRLGGPVLLGPRGPAVTKRFCEALRRGLPKRLAAAAAGIGERTYHSWRQRGEAGEEPYASFMAKVYEVEAELADDLLRSLVGVATGIDEGTKDADKIKAAMFLLERRFPRDFGSKRAVELTGAEGGPVKTEASQPVFTDAQLAAMSPEQLAAALDALGEAG